MSCALADELKRLDIAQMLRDAYMAGVEATREAYVGPLELDANEYAAKIIGGQN